MICRKPGGTRAGKRWDGRLTNQRGTFFAVCARLIGPEVKLTIEQNPLGNLSGQDWAIMGEIVDAVLEYLRAKLAD